MPRARLRRRPDAARAVGLRLRRDQYDRARRARPAEIWIGTDDGLVWLTRMAQRTGATSRRPQPHGRRSAASTCREQRRASPTSRSTTTARTTSAIRLKTSDYGASGRDISAGLPSGHFVSVVRADPVRPGLLYAGTEMGVDVSFDDGAHWQSLQRNLPPAWVHDLLVKDRDLVAATNGRAIWVLDDLSPLRQVRARQRGARGFVCAGTGVAAAREPRPRRHATDTRNSARPKPADRRGDRLLARARTRAVRSCSRCGTRTAT